MYALCQACRGHVLDSGQKWEIILSRAHPIYCVRLRMGCSATDFV